MTARRKSLFKEELKRLEKRVSDWVGSPEGQKSIQDAIKKSERKKPR
jgi:hypothetical protein